jgi:predicted protein tyrosine phosphatase
MKKYLFVCQHNFTRSKFGAEFFRGYLKGKGIKSKVKSAGIGPSSYILGRRINKRILKNKDWIFVREVWMKKYLVKNFKIDKNKIVVLNIEDKYGFLRKKNIDELDKKFKKIDWSKYL